MQVKDLIKVLSEMNPDAKVMYADDGGDTMSVDSVYGFLPQELIITEEKLESSWFDVELNDVVCLFAPQF